MNHERGESVQFVVKEITDLDAESVREEFRVKGVDLGVEAIMQAVEIDKFISKMREGQGGRKYLVAWVGERSPRGLTVEGKTIGWTQHGTIRSVDNEEIGTYDRLIDERSPNGHKEAMVIYMNE